jgi:acyl-CoA thioester hydrolase
MQELLSDFPVIIERLVDWGEMDAFEHVNNIYYFRYFENARLAYFDRLRFMEVKAETGIGPILASTSCRFKAPLSYPDTISVGTRVTDIDSDRFIMYYSIVSHSMQRIAAEGEGLIVSYDYTRSQKALIPDLIRQRILDLEATVL